MTKLEELFGLSPNLAFHENDLHPDVYENLVTEVDQKSKQYYSNPHSNGDRDLATIRFNTWTGMVAEKFLIQEHGFTQDHGKFRDLKKNLLQAEIKTATSEASKQRILNKLQNVRKTKYDHVIMFKRTGKSYSVESYHRYDHDKNKYVQIESYCVY